MRVWWCVAAAVSTAIAATDAGNVSFVQYLSQAGGALAWRRRSTSSRLEELRCAAAAGGPPLEVVAIGGSMTKGTGCGRIAGCPWPARLAARAAVARDSGARIRIHNLAVSGTCTGCVTASLPLRLDMNVPNVSVVLWDYGVNDADSHKAVYRQGRFKDLRRAAADVFLRGLLSRVPPPAVVVIEGSGLVTPHAAAAEHYDLDILAYHKMTARVPAPLRHNCSWKANQAHPPPTVHHALGDLVWWFLAARPTDCSHTTRVETPLPAPLASVAERSMFVTCSAPLDYYASLPPGEPSLGTAASTVGSAWRVHRVGIVSHVHSRHWLLPTQALHRGRRRRTSGQVRLARNRDPWSIFGRCQTGVLAQFLNGGSARRRAPPVLRLERNGCCLRGWGSAKRGGALCALARPVHAARHDDLRLWHSHQRQQPVKEAPS